MKSGVAIACAFGVAIFGHVRGPSPVLLEAMSLLHDAHGVQADVVDKVVAARFGPQELVGMTEWSADRVEREFAWRSTLLNGTDAERVLMSARILKYYHEKISTDAHYNDLSGKTTWLLALLGCHPDMLDLFHKSYEHDEDLRAGFVAAYYNYTLPDADLNVLLYK